MGSRLVRALHFFTMTGRKRDLVWLYFDELPNKGDRKGHRAKCKKCEKILEGQVSRLKKHLEKCKGGTNTDSDDDGKKFI